MFDITVSGAFIAGLLSFLSPCILPIVPFYLSYLAGVGMNQISESSRYFARCPQTGLSRGALLCGWRDHDLYGAWGNGEPVWPSGPRVV